MKHPLGQRRRATHHATMPARAPKTTSPKARSSGKRSHLPRHPNQAIDFLFDARAGFRAEVLGRWSAQEPEKARNREACRPGELSYRIWDNIIWDNTVKKQAQNYVESASNQHSSATHSRTDACADSSSGPRDRSGR